MTFTITLDSLLRTILLVVGIVAVIILIVLMIRIIKTLKALPETLEHVNSIADNVDTISTMGRNAVTSASAAISGMKQAADENRGPIRAATGFVNAVTGLVAMAKNKESKKK